MKAAFGLDLSARIATIEGRVQGVEETMSALAEAVGDLMGDKR